MTVIKPKLVTNIYIVTKLSDKKCQVRKFTKHRFRTRAYDVSCSSCYPVMSTTLPVDTGPVRGLDHSDTESDTDQADQPCTQFLDDSTPIVPVTLTAPPETVTLPEPGRSSSRIRKPPSWQINDWILDT